MQTWPAPEYSFNIENPPIIVTFYDQGRATHIEVAPLDRNVNVTSSAFSIGRIQSPEISIDHFRHHGLKCAFWAP